MADQSKATWPKTPDGTTDWEVVFEDPTMGFITLVSRAHSAEMVEKTAVVIIKKLFTRRNDLDLCQQNIHRVGEIVKDHKDDLNHIHEEIAVLMRQIKNERIELARVFVERKAAGAAIDRRVGIFWKAEGIFSPKVLIPVGLLFIVALAGIVYMTLQTTLVTPTDPTAEFGQTVADPSSSFDSSGSRQFDSTDSTKPDPIPIWLKTVRWPLVPKSDGAAPKFYSVTLYVEGHEIKSAVCGRVESIMDRIIVAFNATMPQSREPRIDELSATEDEIKDSINILFSANVIETAKIARYGSSGFKAATLPPFCKAPPRRLK